MKTSMLYLFVIALLALSCHTKAPIVRVSCCARESAVATNAVLLDNSGGSIYQLSGKWRDQHDRPFALADLKGKVQVVAMIFTHCDFACPRIVQDMKAIEDSLTVQERDGVGYVLVSFDPERDTPEQLSRYSAQQHLDNHWKLLHGTAAQIRELSMVLDVKYRELTDGNFGHSNVIIVLDKGGRIVRRFEGLSEETNIMSIAVRQLADESEHLMP